MSDSWNPTSMSIRKNAELRKCGYQLYSGLLLLGDGVNPSDINALTNIGHNLALNKYYFEASIDELSTTPGDDGAGIGIDVRTDVFDPIFASASGMVLYSNGKVYNNGVAVHTIPVAPVNGLNGIVGVAVGGGQIWWRINGGFWNGIAAADPAKGTQGFSIVAAPVHWIFGNVGCEEDGHLSVMEINTGPIFEYPQPVGFDAWAAIVPVSASSPCPSAPNAISPGGTKGIRWSYTDTKSW